MGEREKVPSLPCHFTSPSSFTHSLTGLIFLTCLGKTERVKLTQLIFLASLGNSITDRKDQAGKHTRLILFLSQSKTEGRRGRITVKTHFTNLPHISG